MQNPRTPLRTESVKIVKYRIRQYLLSIESAKIHKYRICQYCQVQNPPKPPSTESAKIGKYIIRRNTRVQNTPKTLSAQIAKCKVQNNKVHGPQTPNSSLDKHMHVYSIPHTHKPSFVKQTRFSRIPQKTNS